MNNRNEKKLWERKCWNQNLDSTIAKWWKKYKDIVINKKQDKGLEFERIVRNCSKERIIEYAKVLKE
jgi:hypothetical protein